MTGLAGAAACPSIDINEVSYTGAILLIELMAAMTDREIELPSIRDVTLNTRRGLATRWRQRLSELQQETWSDLSQKCYYRKSSTAMCTVTAAGAASTEAGAKDGTRALLGASGAALLRAVCLAS
jgi:hypothetical protein